MLEKLKILLGLVVILFVAAGFISGAYDWFTGERKISPPPTAKVEKKESKPSPPKVETPAESFYAESYDAIATKTGMRVTDSWLLEFSERVTPDGNVDTHGFVELNDDGIKRQFWLIFDGKTRQVLRVKIDGALVFTAVGR